MNALEKWIKPHGEHCLAGKYSTMGRCSCGRENAVAELARLRRIEAALARILVARWNMKANTIDAGLHLAIQDAGMLFKSVRECEELAAALTESDQP